MKKTHIFLASTLAAAMLASACSKTPAETSAMAQDANQAATTAQTTAAAAVSDAAASTSDNAAAPAAASADLLTFCSEHTDSSMGHELYLRDQDHKSAGFLQINDDGTFLFVEQEYDPSTDLVNNKAVTGTFTSIVQEGDHIYSLTVGPTNQDHPTGETWTGTRNIEGNEVEFTYIASDSDIIKENTVLTVYDSGVNKSDLPADFQADLAFVLTLDETATPDVLPDQLTDSPCIGIYIADANASIC